MTNAGSDTRDDALAKGLVPDRMPPQIIEHGLYAATIGLMSAIIISAGQYLAMPEESALGRIAFALGTAGIGLHLLPIALGLAPLVSNVQGVGGPFFLNAYFLVVLPVGFILWLTLPVAVFGRLLLPYGVYHQASLAADSTERSHLAFTAFVWSAGGAVSALGLAAFYGLIMARFFHRQGYFHSEAAAEMLIYSALPCAFTPVILMVVRRGIQTAVRRWRV